MNSASLKHGAFSTIWKVAAVYEHEKCGPPSAYVPRVQGSSTSALAAGDLRKLFEEGSLHDALQAVDSNCICNNVLFILLQRCINEKNLTAGRELHSRIVGSGFDDDAFVGTHLIRMFTVFASLAEAQRVFIKLSNPNVFSWRAIIAAHAKLGQNEQAINLFHIMQKWNVDPNAHVYVAVLEACATAAALTQGRAVHTQIVEHGFESHVFVGNTLLNMYAKCESLHNADTVFNRLPVRDVVTWNVMIAGYGENGSGYKAIQLFQKMQQGGVEPTKVTFVSVLKACSSMADLEQGKRIHICAIECGYGLDLSVSGILIDMYGNCRNLEDARAVFDKLPKRDAVMWNTFIAVCAQHDHGQEALQLFQQMQKEGTEPNEVAFACILKACSSMAALEQGKLIHGQIMERGFESNIFVGTALIDMYCKCGSLDTAGVVFNRLPERNIVTWSTMILGYALHGNYALAFKHFQFMEQVGLKPNNVTFLCLLSAYSHLGLVDEGCLHFKLMRDEHGIVPTIEHSNAMVDLLGHAGLLSEAEDLLESIPAQSNNVGWTSLLNSCRTHGNVVVGRRCFDSVVAMDSGKAAGYVLMSNVYAHAGLQEEAEKVESLRRYANAWKKTGKAFIEIEREVHEFNVADRTHPQSDSIYAKLKVLSMQMRQEGYKPHLDLVLDSVSAEDKEDILREHCEKLAIAFGLISTSPGTTIRITKNLRMCADCHIAAKIISKIELREIIVTDAYCIHHFKSGACSCRDCY